MSKLNILRIKNALGGIFLNFCLKLSIIASEEQRDKLKLLTRFCK